MRLSDVVASLELTSYPIIGLVAFVAVFVVVGWRAMRTSKAALNHYANLPLESGEETTQPTPTSAQSPAANAGGVS